MNLDKYIIKTKKLNLRPLNLNDRKTTHEYASDIENTKYMMHLPNINIGETEQFLSKVVLEWNKDKPTFYEWAIISDESHIGAISIYLNESREEGEIGWIISRSHQDNGYATEAAEAILNFARDVLNVKKITAHCDFRNIPSICVMKKIGLELERDDKIRKYKNSDEYFQSLMFSLFF